MPLLSDDIHAFHYHGQMAMLCLLARTVNKSPYGETGRRNGLKIRRPYGHVGSTPTRGNVK